MSAFVASIADLDTLAQRLFRAGVFSSEVRNEDVAFAILLAGHELGFSPTVAVRGIGFSRGKISLSADLTVAACVRHREVCEWFRLTESTAQAATYATKRVGCEPVSLTWTIEQAKRAGLIDKNSVWKAHTEAMLRARCAMALARSTYPDLVAGVYDPDEVAEINRRDSPERGGESPAPAPAVEAPRSSPLTAFRGDLHDCETLSDVVACWHQHAQALHAADVTDTANGDVGDWMGEHGYAVTATEQQKILARAWELDALRVADELARLGGRMGVVEWYAKDARARVEKLRDPAEVKRLIARTWAVRSERDATRPGPAFAEAVKSFEATGTVPAPEVEPEPIVTSKGGTLRSEEDVAKHVRAIKVTAHLESTARKYGAHPWARGPLTERAEELLDVPAPAAAAQVAAWAAEGPKAPAVPPELAEFYARVPEIELPGEGVAVWMKHRPALEAVAKEAHDAAWGALCDRVGEVGKMGARGARTWLKKAVEEETARRAAGVQ